MKTLIRIARRVLSYLDARNEPDFASPHIPTVHHPHSQGDEYLAGVRRRARQDEHLAGFPSRPIVDSIHGWKIPSPLGKLPVDD
jgi:hypothetical protein